MPLLLLSPDDRQFKNALEITITVDKPANFERMIDMVKDFQDICLSRCLLSTFPSMIKNANAKVLEYFDKAHYQPPSMQQPLVIKWDHKISRLVFAHDTSLITGETLR